MVASHTPPMRPGRGREAPPGRQGGSGVPGGVSGPRRSTGGTRARSGGGLDRRLAPLNRGRARIALREKPAHAVPLYLALGRKTRSAFFTPVLASAFFARSLRVFLKT